MLTVNLIFGINNVFFKIAICISIIRVLEFFIGIDYEMDNYFFRLGFNSTFVYLENMNLLELSILLL